MTRTEENQQLAEALSQRVAREFVPSVWHSLFVARTEVPRVRTGTWTVVCAEGTQVGQLSQDAVRAALSALASRHDGFVDAGAGSRAFAAFADPGAALRMALKLQRLTLGERVRLGLATGRGGVARFPVQGAIASLLLGPQVARALSLTQRAAAGTVQLCAETYEALAGFSPELDSCVVMAEYEQDTLTQVALTLPPARDEALSTFAGLGLC